MKLIIFSLFMLFVDCIICSPVILVDDIIKTMLERKIVEFSPDVTKNVQTALVNIAHLIMMNHMVDEDGLKVVLRSEFCKFDDEERKIECEDEVNKQGDILWFEFDNFFNGSHNIEYII